MSLISLEKAKDPNTTLEELRFIYNNSYANEEIRKAMAFNPNISVELFCQLACYFPKEIHNNPVKELFDLENPNWIDKLDNYFPAIKRLLSVDFEYWSKRLSLSDVSSVLAHLVKDRMTSLEVLKTFVNKSDEIKSLLAQHPNISTEIIEHLHNNNVRNRNNLQYFDTISKNLAKNKKTPSYILKQLASHRDDDVRRSVATNKNSTLEIVEIILQNTPEHYQTYKIAIDRKQKKLKEINK